jgi:hypothetical protein
VKNSGLIVRMRAMSGVSLGMCRGGFDQAPLARGDVAEPGPAHQAIADPQALALGVDNEAAAAQEGHVGQERAVQRRLAPGCVAAQPGGVAEGVAQGHAPLLRLSLNDVKKYIAIYALLRNTQQ